MRRTAPTLAPALLALAATAGAPASHEPAPTAEAIPSLAADLAPRLASIEVVTPEGPKVALGEVLDLARLTRCLDSVRLAGGWPSSWLVVQDHSRPYDLVVRIRLADAEHVATPETAFATPRRTWDDAALDAAVRVATGHKPERERQRSLVVQSFTKKTTTTYIYDLPKTGKEA